MTPPDTVSTPLPLCVQNAQRFDVKTSASTQSDLRKMIKQGFLTKCVEVRIVIPEVSRSIRHRIKAKRGEYINRAGIEQVPRQECDNCVKHLPQYDFRIVVFSPDRFNLIGEVKGLHPVATLDAEHSASCDAEDGRGISTPIDSPASAAFPTNETRSIIPLGGCDPKEGLVLDEVERYSDDDLSANVACYDVTRTHGGAL